MAIALKARPLDAHAPDTKAKPDYAAMRKRIGKKFPKIIAKLAK